MTYAFEDFEIGSAVTLGAHTFTRGDRRICGALRSATVSSLGGGGRGVAFRRARRERLEHLFRDDGHPRARHVARFDLDGLARSRQHPLDQAGARRR